MPRTVIRFHCRLDNVSNDRRTKGDPGWRSTFMLQLKLQKRVQMHALVVTVKKFIVMTTTGTTDDDKVVIMITLWVQRQNISAWGPVHCQFGFMIQSVSQSACRQCSNVIFRFWHHSNVLHLMIKMRELFGASPLLPIIGSQGRIQDLQLGVAQKNWKLKKKKRGGGGGETFQT